MSRLLAHQDRHARQRRRRSWSLAIASFVVVAAIVISQAPDEEHRATLLIAATDLHVAPEQLSRLAPSLLTTDSVREQVSSSLGLSLDDASTLVDTNVTIELIAGAAATRVVAQTRDPERAVVIAESVGQALKSDLMSLGLGAFRIWPADVQPVPRPSPGSATSLLAAGLALAAIRFGLVMWPASPQRDHRPAD